MTATEGNQALLKQFRATSQSAVNFVLGIGCLVLIGWFFNIPLFKSIFPQWIAMRPSTAVCFILSGLALKLLKTPRHFSKQWVRSLALVIITLAGLSLGNHLLGWNLEIDPLLFPSSAADGRRMALTTALNFVLIGIALWLMTARRAPHHLVQLLAFLTALVSLQVFINYLYGVSLFFGLVYSNPVAAHTSLTFLALVLGICFADPEQGWMKLVASNTAGGITARVLLPPAIAVPVGLGWLRVLGVRLGLFDDAVGLSLHVLGNVLAFIGLVWYCSRRLYRIDLRRGRAETALQAAYDDLEIRVQQRTVELSQANQALEQKIQEHRQAETALRESQENLQAFVDNTPAVIYMKDLQGRFLLINRQFEKLFGSRREETLGKTDYDIFPEDLASAFHAGNRQILETGRAVEFEERLSQPDGPHTYSSIKFPLYDANQVLFAIGGISTDISDRKRAEEERDHFFSLSIDMLCIAGTDGYFKQLNPAWERTLGYSREELMAQPFINFVHPLDRERTLAEAADHAVGSPAPIFENRYRCKDGSYKWLEWASVANPDKDLLYAAARDVTARKQTEQQLAQQAEVLRRQADLLELTYEAIIVRDEQGAITYWNRGAELMYGWQRGEAIGHITHSFLHTQPPVPGMDLDQTVLQEEHWQGELIHTRRDGQQIVVGSRQVVIRDDYDKPTGFLEVNRDITERKQAEESIRQLNATLEQRVQERTAQLVEINQELKRFTYTVSHDLRSPLRAIRGLIDALLEDYWDCLDEIGQEYTQHIARSAERMDTLIQDLLTYSRLGQTEIQLESVNLTTVMQEILTQLEPERQAKQARIEVTLPLPHVLAQPIILTQVLINLLTNALKYVAPDVRPQIRVWAEHRQDWVRLWVADNGIGIDPDYHDRIFGVFERLHPANAYSGTGVGLAIVQKGIERMGGRVGVESDLGQGSRFWLELPVGEQG
ncbi:MAG TPA: PAS domain S-box protein [Leptolyngbyaceae cyanobacterium]